MDIGELSGKTLTELRDIAREMEITGFSTMRKQNLIFGILQTEAESRGFNFRGGILDIVAGPELFTWTR